MELIYLWVEGYKNIENQGFNFSPRFECKFHDKYDNGKLQYNCKLEIIEKKEDEYIKDFFGKKINVTAIVGKNGSGKSSVLECLSKIFHIEIKKKENHLIDDEHDFNFVLFFYINKQKCEIRQINSNYSNSLDLNLKEIFNHYNFVENNNDIYNKIYLNNQSISQKIVHKYKDKYDLKSSFFFMPNKIIIKKCDLDNKFLKLISDEKHFPFYRNESDSIYLEKKRDTINSEMEFFKNSDEYFQFLLINLQKENISTDIFYEDKESVIKKLDNPLSEKNFYQYFKDKELQDISTLNNDEKNIYIEKYNDFFEFDFIDEKKRKYNDLSHGEQVLFGQLLNIYYYASKNTNLLFLFDEPEIALHPQWQKNYFNEIQSLLEGLDKRIHFIFASHSPFLLSDIPKQNIIFLDKDKKTGKCIVREELNEKKQTFGANIHTLLSDSFFMDDGLMGEFAKGKIMQIKKFHQKVIKYKKNEKIKQKYKCFYEKKQKEFEQIQSIIGEPFLKRVIKNYLDDLEIIFSDDNTLIEKELAEIEKRKAYLEGLKNDKT